VPEPGLDSRTGREYIRLEERKIGVNKRPAAFILAAALTAPALWGQAVRDPVWAGQFYEADPARLSVQIDFFLQNAGAGGPDNVIALIAPHAGYVYSGQTAAYAYRLVKDKPFDTVVVLGPSHRFGFRGCSIYDRGAFRTPLGTVSVDEALAAELEKRSGFAFIPEAHAEEHSIEVQVPFVQKVLPSAKIVPVVIGYPEKKTVETLASALAGACAGKRVLVVASTDMSHFLTKDGANKMDAGTIELIKGLKAETIIRRMEDRENILCGGAAVAAAIFFAGKRGPVRAEILKYADSSAASGDESRVVGYVAAALVAGTPEPERFALTGADRKELLALARAAVVAAVEEGRIVDDPSPGPNLKAARGAFVTLKRRGRLRGCIGFIEPVMPLYQAVIGGAVYAATKDTRFDPVSKSELKDLECEISVLTPLAEVENPRLIKVGTHGLVIEKNGRKGILLPQVPVENGWTLDQFLEQICLKAGLPEDSWRNGAKLYSFEAIVFHD
jgi:MEMO1 family protein